MTELSEKRAVRAIVAFFAAVALAAGFFAVCRPRAASALTNVDVWLILGQSNATGYSKVTGSEADGTFPNVMLAGSADPKLEAGNGGAYKYLTYSTMQSVGKGLGANSGSIGPEYGMAKYFNDKYSASNKAILFKWATGATNLTNNCNTDSDKQLGNWYPRSLWPDGTPSSGTDYVGGMYRGFIKGFTAFCDDLKSSGFQPVVRGIAWGQGEDDRNYMGEYRACFRAFCKDLREDITDITGVDASNAFIAIMEVCEDFSSYSQRDKNLQFIELQHELTTYAEVSPAATVETGDMHMNLPDGTKVGSDNAHFNYTDMITLGMRYGETLWNAKADNVIVTAEGGGMVRADKTHYDDGESGTLKVVPDEGYTLEGLKVNGQDVFGSLVGDTLTFTADANGLRVEAKFRALGRFNITIEGARYVLNRTVREVYEGGTVHVTPTVPEGKALESITFNDLPMTYNEKEKWYEYSPVMSDGVVKIVLRDAVGGDAGESGDSDGTSDGTENKGCGNGDIALALAAIGALAAAAVVLKR